MPLPCSHLRAKRQRTWLRIGSSVDRPQQFCPALRVDRDVATGNIRYEEHSRVRKRLRK